MKFRSLLIVTLCSRFIAASAQKVGLVLSGGGAKGMAHLGVIKALEENGIPIDYITGTSMGAIVGGLYASGYSVEDMEAIFSDPEFDNWIKGNINDKYIYFFRQEPPNSAWVKFRFAIDSSKFNPLIPVNIITPIQMDFAFLEIFSQADAISKGNFDSLFVPFRCVATNITESKEAVLSSGCLKDAIRASMTFPFYFRPIEIDSNLMYDGGMINNFPIDVMQKDFNPDYIIAVAVAKTNSDPSDENLLSVLNSMLMAKQFYCMDDSLAGIVICPDVPNLNVTDFTRGRKLIEVGYQTLLDSLHAIPDNLKHLRSADSVNLRRKEFLSRQTEIYINKVNAKGVQKNETAAAKNIIFNDAHIIDLNTFKNRYFRLLNEEYISNIYPTLQKNEDDPYFTANLNISLNKPFQVKFGGYITTNAYTTFYAMLRYDFWKRYFMNVTAEAHFGRFYNSIVGSFRISNPTQHINDQTISVGYSRWDHFKSTRMFLESDNPSFLVNEEVIVNYAVATPIGNKAKFCAHLGFVNNKSKFYTNNAYSQNDTFNVNRVVLLAPKIYYEYNTLDIKFFPTKGMRAYIGASYFVGTEQNRPGSHSSETINKNYFRNWFSVNVEYEYNFKIARFYSLGLSSTFAWSNIPRMSSYTATKLRCTAFRPTHESNMLYLPFYRDPSFITAGLSNSFVLYKNLQLRVAGYYYQPFYAIVKVNNDKCDFSQLCEKRSFIIYGSLAYTTKLGPISINLSYYAHNDPKWIFNISFGYLFFNHRIF